MNLIASWFNKKKRIKELEAEVEDLKRILASLIGPAERSIDYFVAGEQLAKHVKQLQERLGIGRPWAGVA